MLYVIVDILKCFLWDLCLLVIDCCNFCCWYCMFEEIFGVDYLFLFVENIFLFDELERFIRLFVLLGVKKVCIMGGELLLRKGLSDLINCLK